MDTENLSRIDLVHNFPPSYPWYKRWWSNITYHLSRVPFFPRKNQLTGADIKEVKKHIQNGDILLAGNFQHLSWLVIPGIVTHAMGYIGKGRCIHAFAKWVAFISLHRVFRSYDTLVLIRPRWQSDTQIRLYRDFLIEKIGMPYDFFFWLDKESVESYFCSELVNEWLKSALYDSWLSSLREAKDDIEKALDKTYRAERALKPEEMIYGNFDVVTFSHNIREKDGQYVLKNGEFSKYI
jgi:hypothetical protein